MAGLKMVAVAMLAAAAPAEPAAEPALPEWMAGCWEQHAEERWTEECWMSPRGGIMLGVSRSGTGDTLGNWEAMQIVLDRPGTGAPAGMTFWASPGGTHRTKFAWRAAIDAGVTFENRANDYPQRIRYWREGEMLVAEIALQDGSRPLRWRYRRMVE